jgi:hypothetical protein
LRWTSGTKSTAKACDAGYLGKLGRWQGERSLELMGRSSPANLAQHSALLHNDTYSRKVQVIASGFDRKPLKFAAPTRSFALYLSSLPPPDVFHAYSI